MGPVDRFKVGLHIAESKTNEVGRLRSLLCLVNGMLRGHPNKFPTDYLMIDAINRELGIDDLGLMRFKKEFEAIGGSDD